MRQKVRVVFALQTYLNDVLIPVAHRLWQCAEAEGLAWRVAVNQDDRRLDLTSAWLRVLEPLGENATLVKSNNVHELRAYNLMARMFDADYIIFLQDDDIPPHDCDWLRRGLRPFFMDSKAGALPTGDARRSVGVLGNTEIPNVPRRSRGVTLSEILFSRAAGRGLRVRPPCRDARSCTQRIVILCTWS